MASVVEGPMNSPEELAVVARDDVQDDVQSVPGRAPIAWVEVGRFLAILAVMSIHVASTLVIRPTRVSSFWFGDLVESASRWCVPMFVMISGYLLLSSPRTADARSFYRRRLLRIGPALVVWTIVYLLFGHLLSGVPGDIETALRSVAYGRPYYHLYFVYLIAGLYVVAPLLRVFVASVSRTAVAWAAAIALGLAMIDSVLAALAGIGTANAVTRFVPYIGYFLAGYVLALPATKARHLWPVIGIAAFGVAATAIGTAILVQPGLLGLGQGRYLYEYLSITTVPVSLAVFRLLVWAGPWLDAHRAGQAYRIAAYIGGAAFGIYLVHPIFLAILGEHGITARMTIAPIAFTVVMVLALGLSLATVAVMRRLPFARSIV